MRSSGTNNGYTSKGFNNSCFDHYFRVILYSDEAIKGLFTIEELTDLSPQIKEYIATWSKEALENAKTWPKATWAIKRVELKNGEYGLLLEKIEDAVGSKSIIGRTKTPLSPPENTEVVTQKTINTLEDIYQKLKKAGANVGDFQFLVRRSDGEVFVNDPTNFGLRRQRPQGDIQNIIERFKKILKDKK